MFYDEPVIKEYIPVAFIIPPSYQPSILSIKNSTKFTKCYLISSPFSSNDLSFGSGGTFPTHGFILFPPTDNVQDPQSPLLCVCV